MAPKTDTPAKPNGTAPKPDAVAKANAPAPPARPSDVLKSMLNADSVREQFKNALGENSGAFVASIIDIYNTDSYLAQCEPRAVVFEALKAASLKLPINKSLGFAWIVPYKEGGRMVPHFQIGYKGMIQLAIRTGLYECINADAVREGQFVSREFLSGDVDLSGPKKGEKIVGYFAYLRLKGGFAKCFYMTAEEMLAHAKKYSKSFNSEKSAWKTDYEKMAIKTALRLLLGHYGIMSTDMIAAMTADDDEREIPNAEFVDITPPEPDADPNRIEPAAPRDDAPPSDPAAELFGED